MIDHIGIRPRDLEASRRFYDAALGALGLVAVMEVTPEESGGVHSIGYGKEGKPYFWLSQDISLPAAGDAREACVHIAFAASSRTMVDAFYDAAIAHGGRDNGAPGVRRRYHPDYYAAFVIDPDGCNVESVCHAAE